MAIFEDQKHQIECVKNIVKILRDYRRLVRLPVSDASRILEGSVKKLQQEKRIPILKTSNNKLKLDVLMETGTGKTFTYIKTMYALHDVYGINKFVVFVPRLAIREGLLQNIDEISNYLSGEYSNNKVTLKKHSYDGKGNKSSVEEYIRDKNIFSVLILTSSSISSNRKDTRILKRNAENITEEKQIGMLPHISSPLSSIRSLRPVVIIDEPHLLKGEEFSKAFDEYFGNSLCIRFGATFPEDEHHQLSNTVYVLDSLTAFRENLVKNIRVHKLGGSSEKILFFKTTPLEKKDIAVSYTKNNIVERKTLAYRENIDVGRYKGVSVVKVSKNIVYLSDKTKAELSSGSYRLSENDIRGLVKETIKLHFQKEIFLFPKNIKTLSLFFIPNIKDFRGNQPIIKNIFDEEYKEECEGILTSKKINLSREYRGFLNKCREGNSRSLVREGYFSDDRGSKDEQERKAVNDILKDKKNLLSLENPLRFIFSVWALQEGWDNPNIFNICKLASSGVDTSRRQQVGRGLRIAVRSSGIRTTREHCRQEGENFEELNILNVVISAQEGNFIEGIQKEISESSYTTGNMLTEDTLDRLGLDLSEKSSFVNFLQTNNVVSKSDNLKVWIIEESIFDFLIENAERLPENLKKHYESLLEEFSQTSVNPVTDGRKAQDMIGVRKNKFEDFKELWETITQKTSMKYTAIKEKSLLENIVRSFEEEKIHKLEMTKEVQEYNPHLNEVVPVEQVKIGDYNFLQGKEYSDFVLKFARKEKLPLRFVIEMFNRLDKNKIRNDPLVAYQYLEKITREEIHKEVIQSVSYNFDSQVSISSSSPVRSFFYDDKGEVRKSVERSSIGSYVKKDVSPAPSFLYDTVVYDSGIEKTAAMEDPPGIDKNKIVVFVKLSRLSIPTPYKTYSPDFAYFVSTREGKKLFLVVETKGYDLRRRISEEEKKKIENNIIIATDSFNKMLYKFYRFRI